MYQLSKLVHSRHMTAWSAVAPPDLWTVKSTYLPSNQALRSALLLLSRGLKMVAPVSGPVVVTNSFRGPPNSSGYKPEWRWKRRISFRQKRPFNLHLPFTYQSYEVKSVNDTVNHTVEYTAVPVSSINSQRVYNQAYQSFIGKMRAETAQLGALYGERKQAMSMIQTRLNGLVTGLRMVRRGDVKGLKRAWGKHAGIRRRSKATGDNILETCFGWGPLISDIAGAVEVLAKGVPPVYVKKRFTQRELQSTTSYLGAVDRHYRVQDSCSYQIQATIRVDNPNTNLAQSLGLVNLGSVLWELTPWSFVVDYFANVNTFIGSFSDFVGLEVLASSHTLFTITDSVVHDTWNVPDPGYSALFFTGQYVYMQRTVGIETPTLALRPPWRLSPFRALTSIGLLLQQIKGK